MGHYICFGCTQNCSVLVISDHCKYLAKSARKLQGGGLGTLPPPTVPFCDHLGSPFLKKPFPAAANVAAGNTVKVV